MYKIDRLETVDIVLMPYNNIEDDYITKLHKLSSKFVLDDNKRNSNFSNVIKNSINSDTTGWICLTKKPIIRIGIVYFSHIEPQMSAMFHHIFDTNGYKMYLKNSGKQNQVLFLDSCKTAIKYMFKKFGLHRISTTQFAYNTLSLNFCKKLGFVNEGLLRHGAIVNNQLIDVDVMGLLPNEML